MNTDEFLHELSNAHGIMNKISNAIASSEGITGNADYRYLKDKFETFSLTTDHVLGQLKNKMKEQKRMSTHGIAKR